MAMKPFRFAIDNPLKTIVFPIIVIVLINLIFKAAGYNVVSQPFTDLQAFIVLAIILMPILEELFFRGLILGTFMMFANKLDNINIKLAIIITGFFLQLFLFVFIGHASYGNLAMVMSLGILISILFMINNRNLLPAIIAHVTNNLLILLLTMF